MNATNPTPVQAIPLTAVELADRVGDGLEVSLWWDRPTGRVWVDVRGRSGRRSIVAAEPERALEVFHHPFAYCTAGVEDVLAAA